jgi:hypothetical protein
MVAKRTEESATRKGPRAAILRLAQQLHEEARRSDSYADAIVAELVACAWLLDVRRGKGSRAIEHAARALLATIDGSHVAERSTPRPLPSPTSWWDAMQRFAADRLEPIQQFQSETPRRRAAVHALIATAMVEHAIALIPGVEATRDEAVARLLVRLDGRMPKDAAQLARWTLTACEVPGERTNRADAGSRAKRRRIAEK